MDKWTNLELLRYLFYCRFGIGNKVEEVIAEDHQELWREIYQRLNPEEY